MKGVHAFEIDQLKKRLIELYAVVQSFGARIRYSRSFWIYVATITLGLGLARLTNSIALLAYSRSIPLPQAKPFVPQTASSDQMLVDPGVTIGGVLFQNLVAPEVAVAQPVVAEQPAKPFKLLATFEDAPEYATALFETQGEPIREYCATGPACRRKDCQCNIGGNATLISVAQEYVWIKMGQGRHKLKLGQSSADLLAQIAAAAVQTPTVTPGQPTVTSAGGAHISRVISREEVNRTILGNPAQIYVGAQFGPHLVNGKIEGYKIARVYDDHIFAKLGAKSGDIIRKVNGYGLSDTERMFELWRSIKTAPEVKIEVERDGKTITYDFQIRN